MQLLESRIREGIRGGLTSLKTAGAASGMAGSREEALYQERLKEYEELAQRFDENFKDTVEMAESQGRGFVHAFIPLS
jgi:hypothetical protein